jgi:hypothetical protein
VVKGIKKPYLNRRIISFLRLQAWVLWGLLRKLKEQLNLSESCEKKI